jgi:hypothetical protein
MVLIWCNLDFVMAVEMDIAASLTSEVTTFNLAGNLFYYHRTYLDQFIRRQITEDYGIKAL